MNKEMNGTDYIHMKKDDFDIIFESLKASDDLLKMLIGYYDRESELKKSHRPYLQVREEAEAAIGEIKVFLQQLDNLIKDAKVVPLGEALKNPLAGNAQGMAVRKRDLSDDVKEVRAIFGDALSDENAMKIASCLNDAVDAYMNELRSRDMHRNE